MEDKELETLQAEEQLAINDPQAYLVSNPTPRDWNLSTQDIARSIRIDDPRQMLGLTQEDINGPKPKTWLETVGKGIWDSLSDNPIKEANETRLFYSSPNMTEDEATRLMNDVLFTDYKRREAETIKNAQEIKYKKWYGFSNGVGSAIKYAFLGLVGGPVAGTATVGALAGAESAAQVETELADRYIEKYGKDYTKGEMWKNTGLANAYGVFAGAVEASLGIERIAAGALGRYSKLEALSRLARMEGKSYKSGALKALRRGVLGGAEEGAEELLQNPAEDLTIALAGYAEDLTMDDVFNKAFTGALYGAIIGGTMGWGLYRFNRKRIIDKIKAWSDEKQAGLNDQQATEMADQMLDDGKTKMLDEVTTRVEIRNKYGKAYNIVKQRLLDQINATGTVPWQDKAKTKEEYVETLADTITPPAIFVANKLNIPLTDFLEIADVESWVIGNVIGFKPITSIADIDEIIAKQDAIIKDQREKKKLGIGNEQVLSDAQRRKAIAERVRREVAQNQEIAKRRSTSKKQTADYITARDVQPVSVEALSNAQTAEPGQDFVLVAGKKIPVQYEVVELSSVQPSHIDGTANPNYTNEQLQNRASRGTQQDVADLRGKALPENFTPERLTRANTAAEGAPLVNAAGEVIAGNGRAEIVRYAYENPESAEKYKQALRDSGFNIDGMEKPILVRRNTTLTPDEQIATADISNISETSAFDEASQARRDTQYLKDSATPTEFAAKLPMSDRRGLMQNNGKWNKRRVQQRYESALLSWLCGNDTQLFENLVLDRGISQKIIDVLTANGNLIYETATKYPELELREDIYNALVKMQYTNRNNFLEMTQQLTLDGHDVMPENILVWNWLYADGTTNRQFMNYYATTLANNQERVNTGEDMFGQKVPPLSKKDALIQALKKSDQAKAEMSASNGRDYEPLFDENGTTNNPELLAAIISYNNQFAPVPTDETQTTNPFKEAWEKDHERTSNGGSITRFNDKYKTEVTITPVLSGKNKGKYSVHVRDTNARTDTLTTDGTWGNLGQVDENGVAIPWNAQYFDTHEEAWNAVVAMFEQSQPLNRQLLEQFDLADENARLDDIYPAYDGETINIDGKERSVYNSNGDRIAKSEEALRNFYKWFGDSKVVDKQGRPLVVHHGSRTQGIQEFYNDKPIWVAIDKSRSEFFSGGTIYPLYVKIENPIIFNESLENNVTGGRYTKLLSEATGIPEKELSKKRDWVEGRPELGQKAPIFMYQITNSKWFKDLAKEKGFDGIITIEGNNERVAAVFDNTQIKSVENRGTYSQNTGNILNKIAYTSGKTFYLTPSTRFVLRGGEGQIVHGWGLYLLENMLENARLYRNKFNTGLIYVENMPEENKADQIMAYNGLVGENAKKFREYLSYVFDNRPGWTANEDSIVSRQMARLANIANYFTPLINEKTTPTTAYFTMLASHNYDDPKNKYIKKTDDGKYKFIIPRNLPGGVKYLLQLTNKKIESAGWYDPYVVLSNNLESWLPDGNITIFVSDLVNPQGAKKTPLMKEIADYTFSILRNTNLEPRTTKTPRIAPNLTDEENVQLATKSYVFGPLANMLKQAKDAPHRAMVLLEIIKDLADSKEYKNDYNVLFTASFRTRTKEAPDETEIQNGSSFIQNIYDQAKEDFNTDKPTYDQIRAEFENTIQDTEEWWSYELLPRYIIQNIFGEDISEEFENTARNYIVDMVMKGTNRFQPKQGYDNIDLEQTTATILDSNHQSDYIQMIAESIRRMYDGKQGALDEIVTMMPTLYEGFWGLYALEQTWRNLFTEADASLMNRIAKGEVTFENLETDDDYKTTKGLTDAIPTFATSVLERAKKIYKANTDKDAQPDTKTWAAISDAMKSITDEEKNILNKKFKLDDKDRELFFKILTNPSGIKKTRGQQLEIEIPNADELLNEEQFLADQAAAPKIREFLRSFVDVAPDPTAYLEKGAQSLKDNAYAIKLGVKFTNIADWTEEVRNAAFDFNLNETDITPEKRAELQKKVDDWVSYIMEHMRGENLYRMVMDTLPDMISYLSDGTEIGGDIDDESQRLYDPDKNPTFYVLGNYVTAQNAKETSMWLNDYGIKGTTYRGGTDGRGYVIFSDQSVQTLRRIDDELPMYYQKRGRILGQYDPELQTIMLGKYWNELTLVHEMHHRYLELLWGYFKQAQAGQRTMPQDFINDLEKLFGMLEIDPTQESLTTVQQEKFTYMVEAYLTGLGVENTDNLAFQGFLHWVPEKYKSIMDLGYLDENNIIQNPMLDEESIAWFNKWFASPFAPSLPSSPDAQRMINPTDNDGELLPADQKTMNNREKEWGQDSEEQLKADAQLWRAIDENMAGDARAAMDGEKELMKVEGNNQPDDTKLPEQPKQTFRERWFKARVENARERAANMAREYLAKNPERARELAFADPEISVEYDAPVDRGMLIRAVMETVPHGSDEWYILNDNLAMVKSMAGSALALPGDQSHQAYLNAKREIEAARELKAAVNYAGTSKGAMEKWDGDIKAFIARKAEAILSLAPDSEERKVAIKAMLEEAKTKFSGNTTNAILNQLDLTGMRTKSRQVFIDWAEKQIKQAAHARIDTKEQQELMKASIAAQLALRDIDSTELKDGKFVRAMQSGKDIRHWQYVKDKMKKAYIGRWGRFGIFMDNLFGSYAPSAMLMSVNTLFFANVPSTAVNTATIRLAASWIGKNVVDDQVQKDEIHRIKQVFNASGMNLAQMDKPTSPSTLHGEKYMNTEQKHWYNFTFEILGRTDNEFRVPTFVNTLARIASKNANGDKARATALFKEYCRLNTTSEEAQIARKQALAVANMAVFTQDGTMASALNHIRSALNTISRAPLGLSPNGFGLGNILAPFLKTGVNITEMGLSATFAPLRTAIMGMKKLQGKQIPEIDKIALRSDWINLAWMCVVLAVLAMINSKDDKWYEEPYQTGHRYDPNKPYDSINLDGVWVKLDIFGPLAIPLRAALKMVQDWEKKKMEAVADGLFFGGMEALSDTPLVQQFTDSSLDYMTRQPGAYWTGFGYNQANKLVPAQLKSISRAASRWYNVEMGTDWMGKTISRKFHRNYGLDGERLTTNDLINILTNRLKYNPQ